MIFYSERLEETFEKVKQCGGTIIQPIFSFPGGRRFQFAEPSGTELAVWSDKEQSETDQGSVADRLVTLANAGPVTLILEG